MNIDIPGITTLAPGHVPSAIAKIPVREPQRDAFESFFQSALDVINETNYRQVQSDIAQMNFATGQDTNMLTVILAQERANSTLNFTVQITNRIIEAYREIMRMQV